MCCVLRRYDWYFISIKKDHFWYQISLFRFALLAAKTQIEKMKLKAFSGPSVWHIRSWFTAIHFWVARSHNFTYYYSSGRNIVFFLFEIRRKTDGIPSSPNLLHVFSKVWVCHCVYNCFHFLRSKHADMNNRIMIDECEFFLPKKCVVDLATIRTLVAYVLIHLSTKVHLPLFEKRWKGNCIL